VSERRRFVAASFPLCFDVLRAIMNAKAVPDECFSFKTLAQLPDNAHLKNVGQGCWPADQLCSVKIRTEDTQMTRNRFPSKTLRTGLATFPLWCLVVEMWIVRIVAGRAWQADSSKSQQQAWILYALTNIRLFCAARSLPNLPLM